MKVLVVGAGAIGGPLVLALAADGADRGITSIAVSDDDRIELSNLQRQVHFRIDQVGQAKAPRLAELARGRGVAVAFETRRFTVESADSLADGADLIIDASDNFETKFLVNDVARRRGVSAIIASALSERAQLFVAAIGGPCYRCLFEEPPPEDVGSCAQVGVLAPMPGAVAGHAALAAFALASGERPPHVLVSFEGASAPPRSVTTFAPRPGCSSCAAGARIAS